MSNMPDIYFDDDGHRATAPRTSRTCRVVTVGAGGSVLERLRERVLDAAARHRIIEVEVFGSLATGRDTPESDVDLLVHPEPGASLFDIALFAEEAEAILGFHVDVVSAGATSAAMPRIRAEAVPL
jgi:predicted nucleotidyltransferase